MKQTHPTANEAKVMLDKLLSERCSNYGYDWRLFRRISNQRSRARRALQDYRGTPLSLCWHGAPLARRIQWDKLHYVVGQSENEEITNLLRQLVNPNASWVS